MKNTNFIPIVLFVLIGLQVGFAQSPAATPKPKTSEAVARNIKQTIDKPTVSRERREQAYVKLLEGQRYIWNLTYRSRSQTAVSNGVRPAMQSLRKAIELDPQLAEAYTALAELITLTLTSPENLEEAIALASIAVKIDAESFGGHRILAQLYTIKSRMTNGIMEPTATEKAIAEWKEVGRLDGRNAEAFAFLSEFYARTKNPAERINALRKWLSAVTPLPREARFYQTFFRGQSDLSPDSATLKFGRALLETGETREAVEVLSRAVTDNPENEEAIELLRQAIESSDENSTAMAVQALQQAVYANPANTTLIEILAQAQARGGKINEAAKVLRDSSAKLTDTNKNSAADLQVILGDIYEKADRFDESIHAFQTALTIRGIGAEEVVTDGARDFAIRVFGKMIDVYKKANRPNDAKAVIDRARTVLGKADLFADKRLVSFYLETGKRPEALRAIRALRLKKPADKDLIKLEARILTEEGKVDEAVALVKSAPVQDYGIGNGNGDEGISLGNSISPEVGNYLYISELYTLAKRPREAVQAVSQALSAAKSKDEKEIIKLTLATMQQTNGDANAAEITLREILKESPRNSVALNNLGYFLAERGEKLDEALKLIQQALEIDPNNSSFLDSLGWTYYKLGKLPEAEKNLKAALRIDNTSATVQEHLGDVHQKQGRAELAKSAWQKALALASEADEINRLKTKLKIK